MYAERLWHSSPAFCYSLFVVLGVLAAQYPLWGLCFLLSLSPFIIASMVAHHRTLWIRLFCAVLLAVVSFVLTSGRYEKPNIGVNGVTGEATVELLSVAKTDRISGEKWKYLAVIEDFRSSKTKESLRVKNLPVTILLPIDGQERPLTSQRYRVEGKLKQSKYGSYFFVVRDQSLWMPIGGVWSFADWRFQLKEKLQKHIEGVFHSRHVAAFLSGIATGQFDDAALGFELGRLGLQHLMAISGLHFSILAMLLGAVLMILLPRSIALAAVLFLLSAYFLFLGTTPSVLRAWIALILSFSAVLFSRRHGAWNAWGVALLCVALWRPWWLGSLSFQFSFLITASILIWYRPVEVFLQRIFAKRTLAAVSGQPGWAQHLHCVLFCFRQMLALSMAVNLVAIPLTLYYFYSFPLMSLVYNLFLPLMMSICLLFLVCGLAVDVVSPSLGTVVHALNEWYTTFMLDLTVRLPKGLDVFLQVDAFHMVWLFAYLALVLWGGIAVHFRCMGLYTQRE